MDEVGTMLIVENEQVRVREFSRAGQVSYHRGGDTRGATNVGATRYPEVLVELRTPR